MSSFPAEILSIDPDRSRSYHVQKHLYDQKQMWSEAAPELPEPPYLAPLEAGCEIWPGDPNEGLADRCFELVLHDHDRHYEPAYQRAVEDARRAGRWGFADDGTIHAVGDLGVYVIILEVRRGGREAWKIQTAYRRTPRNREFFEAAVSKLEVKTSWKKEPSMNIPRSVENAEAELRKLRNRELKGDEAWRALALTAVVAAAGNTVSSGEEIAAWAKTADWPNAQRTLDALDRELRAREIASGPLQDQLIDLGEHVLALGLCGLDQEAEDLALRGAALISLWPARVLPLSGFAERSLALLPDSSAARVLWEAVQAAPLELAANTLPAPQRPGLDSVVDRLSPIQPLLERLLGLFELRPLQLARADTNFTTLDLRGGEGQAPAAELFEDNGRLIAEVWASTPIGARLEVTGPDGRILEAHALTAEKRGARTYFDLGPRAQIPGAHYSPDQGLLRLVVYELSDR